MTDITCKVENCEKPLKQRGFCYAHYMKNWRYGTPTPVHGPKWIDIRGQRFGTLVVVDRVGRQWRCLCDCGNERLANAGCLNREGARNTCGVEGAHMRRYVGYGAAHERVRRSRGDARSHPCVDCGAPARHWAYDHSDPDEMTQDVGSKSLVAYSVKVEHYDPRCVPCHKRFDLGRINGTQAFL